MDARTVVQTGRVPGSLANVSQVLLRTRRSRQINSAILIIWFQGIWSFAAALFASVITRAWSADLAHISLFLYLIILLVVGARFLIPDKRPSFFPSEEESSCRVVFIHLVIVVIIIGYFDFEYTSVGPLLY